MSIASVSGRLRAERKARQAQRKSGPQKQWPEDSQEERERQAGIDDAIARARGGHKRENA